MSFISSSQRENEYPFTVTYITSSTCPCPFIVNALRSKEGEYLELLFLVGQSNHSTLFGRFLALYESCERALEGIKKHYWGNFYLSKTIKTLPVNVTSLKELMGKEEVGMYEGTFI